MKKHVVRRKRIALGLIVAVMLIAGTVKTMEHFHLLGDTTPSIYHWLGGAPSSNANCNTYGVTASNCWIERTNWAEGSVPQDRADIVIDNNSTTSPAIPSGVSVTLGYVTIDSPNHWVTNFGTINDGAFYGNVNNYDNINGGNFYGTITNYGGGYTDSIGTIRSGTFTGTVFNNGTIDATGMYYGPPDFTNATVTDYSGRYQCPSGKLWNTSLNACTQCSTDSDCGIHLYCNPTFGSCQTGCRTSSECSSGAACTNHICTNTSSSSSSSNSSSNSSNSSSSSSNSSNSPDSNTNSNNPLGTGFTGGGITTDDGGATGVKGGGGGGGGGLGTQGGTNVTTLGTPGPKEVKGVNLNLTTGTGTLSAADRLAARKAARAAKLAQGTSVATSPAPSVSAPAAQTALQPSNSHTVVLDYTPAAPHAAAGSTPKDVPSGAWFAPAAAKAVSGGWMTAPGGNFSPTGTVTAEDVAVALTALHIDISTLNTLPRDGSTVLSKGAFLQILTGAFQAKLQAILKTKSQAEYSRAWNAIPDAVSHHNAVRMSILAGWISMPNGSFHGSAEITRAEMATILSRVMSSK